jgi:hypothetical protein
MEKKIENTETPQTITPELLELFKAITAWEGTEKAIEMIEGFYEATLFQIDSGSLEDDKNLLRYVQMKNLIALFKQAKKDFDLCP